MAQESKVKSGYDLAVSLAGGNASALARIVGVSPQAVFYWKKAGVVPTESAKKLARIFKVPRERLNPIVFGKD